jgi:hypothetical protein
VADSGGSLELGPANRAAITGVRNRKDTQRVRSNPQQSDPIQVGSDIQQYFDLNSYASYLE